MSTPTETTTTSVTTPRKSRFAALWFTLRMIEVRLRFVAVLVGLGLVIGYWDSVQNYWDRWTRPKVSTASNVSSGTEFYCPMDPAVIRDGLEPSGAVPKCPICGMPLSLRKKGAPMELPPGVVGRVSLTPNRVRMAGIRTSEIGLRPMMQSIRTVGTVTHDESHQSQIVSRFAGYVEQLYVDKTYSYVQKGDPIAAIYSPEVYAAVQELKIARDIPGSNLSKIAREKVRLLGIEDVEIDSLLQSPEQKYRVIIRSPSSGHVIQKLVQQGSNIAQGQMLFEIADLASIWIEAEVYERDIASVQEGQEISATVEAYPNRVFRGRVSLIYPELNPLTRTNRVRFEIANDELHLRAGMYATVVLDTPVQHTEPFQSRLVSTKTIPSDSASAIASQANCPVTGAKLGSMGEPVAVQAGGQTAFLCCKGCEKAIQQNPEKYLSRMRTVSETGVLSVPESAVIDTGNQKIVYVEREEGLYDGVEVQLGPKSDGYYAVVAGLMPGDHVAAAGAFLIDAETRLNPAASASYFGASGSPSASTGTTSTSNNISAMPGMESSDTPSAGGNIPVNDPINGNMPINYSTSRLSAEELAEIGKLSLEDQKLAKKQVLCPVTLEPLGSMGKPLKVIVRGDEIMVCCKGCVKRVEKEADVMLEMVRRWREKNQVPARDESK